MRILTIIVLGVAGCNFSGEIDADLECTASCEEEKEDCYKTCEEECADPKNDGDEACDEDCELQCDEGAEECTLSCESSD